MTVQNRARSLVVAVGVLVTGVVVGACGSANPSAINGSAVASPTSSASVAVASQPVPSIADSPVASSPAPGASLPTTGRILVADKGYALTLPGAWTRVDLAPGALDDVLKAGASSMPAGMQDLIAGQVGQMAMSGVSLFAFRAPDAGLPGGTTLNVLSLPSLGIPLDTFESLVVAQLKGAVGADTDIATARVQGPAGEFLRLTYTLKAAGTSISTVQYLFVAPTKQFVISCGSPGAMAAVQAECESIATTLEIVG